MDHISYLEFILKYNCTQAALFIPMYSDLMVTGDMNSKISNEWSIDEHIQHRWKPKTGKPFSSSPGPTAVITLF